MRSPGKNRSDLKLLYVVTGCGMDHRVGGGSLVRSLALANEMVRRGHEVHFLTTKGGLAAARSRNLEARFHLLPASLFGWGPGHPTSVLNRIFAYLVSSISALWTVPRLPRCDLVYADSDAITDTVSASIYVKRYRVPWVATSHLTIEIKRNSFRDLAITSLSWLGQQLSYVLMRKYATRVFLINGPHGREMGQRLIESGLKPEKILYVNNGVDISAIESVEEPEKVYDACFVGALRPSKGLEDLFRIWKLVVARRPNARLLLIGGTAREYEKDIQQIVSSLGLADSVKFAGHLSDYRKLIQTMKSCRLYTVAFRTESWGIAVCEALAAGLPVVAYDLPVYRELFPGGMKVVPIGEIDFYANEVLELIDDAIGCGNLAKEGKRVASQYDWSAIADQDLGVFISLIQSSKGARPAVR